MWKGGMRLFVMYSLVGYSKALGYCWLHTNIEITVWVDTEQSAGD